MADNNVPISGRTAITTVAVAIVVVITLFAASWWYVTTARGSRAAAERVFTRGKEVLGTTNVKYDGPHLSSYSDRAAVQYCWLPEEAGRGKLCVVVIRQTAEFVLLHYTGDPEKVERILY